MWRLTLRNLRANLTRLVATAVAIIAGTAFVATGLMLTEAISNAVAGNVELQYSAVDAAVTASNVSEGPHGTGGIDAEVLAQIQALPQAAAAAGELDESVKLLDDQGDALRSQSLGRSWITDDELNPFTIVEGTEPGAPGEIAVDRETAEKLAIDLGDEFQLATPAGRISATVVGVTEFGRAASVDGGGSVFFSPAEGLEVLGAGSEQYNRILVRTDGSSAALVDAIESTVPTNAAVMSGADFRERQTAATEEFVAFLKPVLLGFAFLALFVAGFVIYNTFTVVVHQRTRELALVRSIGGTPAQVRRSLLVEGLGLGLGASFVGLAVGVLLSMVVQWLLDRFDVPIPSAGFALTPSIVLITVLAGSIITVVAVMIPAFRAGRTAPVEAMRASAVDHSGTSRARMWIGGALLVLGVAMLMFNLLVDSNGIVLGLGSLSLFLGVVVGGPLLAHLFGRGVRVPLGFSITGRLAADNMVRNPKRTATTANALVIGLFLVTVVTVSGTAFRDWATAELAKITSSDFLMVGITPIPDEVVTAIGEIEGVRDLAPVRQAQVTDASGITAQLSGVDVDKLVSTTGLQASEGSLADVAAGLGAGTAGLEGLLVEDGTGSSQQSSTSVPASEEGGPRLDIGESGSSLSTARVGEVYMLLNPEGEVVEIPVAAVLEIQLDTLFLGTIVNEEVFAEVAGDQPVGQVYIRADQDRIDEIGAELDNLTEDYTGIEALPGNFIGQILGSVIDFFIAAVNGLLGLSVLIALIGIVNTMNLSIHERRRELGMVRALGMTRQQVRSMVRTEAFLIGILGTIIGVTTGVFLGFIVSGSLTDATPSMAWGRVGLILATGIVISVLASLLPARRAVRLEMLDAMGSS